MYEVRPLVTNCLHAVQTATIDQPWLLVAVDTNAPGSGSGLTCYCLDVPENSRLPNSVVLPVSNTRPFFYQAKFNAKVVQQLFAFCQTSNLIASPPVLLLCLDVDSRLALHRWTTLQSGGRYETVRRDSFLKSAPSVQCICCSYSNDSTRALAFSHKREVYAAYWVVDDSSVPNEDSVQLISAIPSSTEKTDKLNSVRLPDHVKGLCWPDGGDRIYVACSKEYLCLVLGKDDVEICPVVKGLNFTNCPTFSLLRSALDKIEWSLLAFQLDSSIEVHASPLTKSKAEATVCQLETQWPSTPSWLLLDGAILIICYQHSQQAVVECRLAIGPDRGSCLKRLVVDTEELQLASSCRCFSKEAGANLIIMHNRTTIFRLQRRDQWDLITEMLAQKQYASALTICEFMADDDDLSEGNIIENNCDDVIGGDNVLAKLKRIRILQATDDFKQKKEYAAAVRTFLDLNVEAPSVLRVICPHLMGGGRRSTANVLTQLVDVEPRAMDEILVYLTERRGRLLGQLKKDDSPSIHNELQIVDTALLRCYAAYKKPMISILVRLPNYCNCSEAAEVLRQCGRENDLLTMYKQKGHHRDALQILKEQTPEAERLQAIVKYFDAILFDELELALEELAKISPAGADAKLEVDRSYTSVYEEECLRLFTTSEHAEQLNRVRICDFLQKFTSSATCMAYLEVAIYRWNDRNERLHTQLGLLYVSIAEHSLEKEEFKQKLNRLFELPQCACDLKILLPLLKIWPHERATVYARLHNYRQAFSIWIEEMGLPESAVNFVTTVDSSQQSVGCLFAALLSSDLKEKRPEMYKKTQEIALELLDSQLASKTQPTTILEILPSDMPLQRISSYLVKAMKTVTDEEREAASLKNIYRKRLEQVAQRKKELEGAVFVIDEDSVCFRCRKRLGNAAVATYPDGNVVHLGCDAILREDNRCREK